MPNIYRTLSSIKQHEAFVHAPAHNMPAIQLVRDQHWQANPADGAALKPSDILSVPGGKILNRMMGERNFANLFTAFCDYFHTPGNWTWNGGTRTPAADAILDGDAGAMTGQCLAFVRALRHLGVTQKPYGLAYSEAQLPNPAIYTGRYDCGFVSDHPAGGILGLAPNVWPAMRYMPTLSSPMAPLYLWENHKVQACDGMFYDPSYRKTYRTLPDMVQYHIRPGGTREDVTHIVFAEDRSGTIVRFVEFGSATCAPYNRLSGYMGPFPMNAEISPEILGLNKPW